MSFDASDSASTCGPSDGLGDGTTATATVIALDVTGLTLKQAADYRHDLILAIRNPGTDFDMVGSQFEVDRAAYKKQLLAVEDQISALGGT